MTVDSSVLLRDGPWRHQHVPANGARFHVAVSGPDDRDVPLVVLLHGFPQFWWAWRHQLGALADAGYRVAAMDLRGTGGSDKPPSGYDVPMLTRDVAGLIRSLGADRAVIVGHGLGGGDVAWAMPAYQPAVTQAIAVLSAPHPLQQRVDLRSALRPGAARHLAYAQLPYLAERSLTRTDLVVRLLREWGGRGYPDAATAAVYRQALQVPFAAHSALEGARWLFRSVPRMDGRRYAAALRTARPLPVLQMHGGTDGCRPAATAAPTGRLAARLGPAYRFELIPGVGHFLPEESPERVTRLLTQWLATLP